MRTIGLLLLGSLAAVLVRLVAQAPAYKARPIGNLKQVMRSVPYPNSNIIFDVQSKVPKDDAEWKTVQNAAMAIAETANLITLPGRLREDGKPVPVQNADWNKFAQGLVSAGQACYKAALTKKQDAVNMCTDQLSDSCSNCHDVYRDKPQSTGKKK
jgi:cytochrome c556